MLNLCSRSWILQLTTLFAFLNKSFWILLSFCSAISVTETFSFTLLYTSIQGYSSSLLPSSLICSQKLEIIDHAHCVDFPACLLNKLSSLCNSSRNSQVWGWSLSGQLKRPMTLFDFIYTWIKFCTWWKGKFQNSKADDLKCNKTLGKSLLKINGETPACFNPHPFQYSVRNSYMTWHPGYVNKGNIAQFTLNW